MREAYDAIVVGGGTMGTSAASALAERGLRCLVLEQFGLVHAFGSHGGRTRIIRQAYAESPDYVPLVQRSEAAWLSLEQDLGLPILHRTGGLDLQAPGYTWAADARRAAAEHHIPHEWLDGAEIRRRWPAWRIGDEWQACYSPSTGFLDVEAALRSVACVAKRRGVVIHEGEAVRRWTADGSGVEVRTEVGRYQANRLIFTAGAWTGPLLESLGLPITVLRKTVWWFDVATSPDFAIGRFPIFIADGPIGSIYGFPIYGVPGIKAGNHAGGVVTTAVTVDRIARDDEAAAVIEFARAALPGMIARLLDRAVCLYSMTPDRDFIVDRHPEHDKVVIAAGFSGHGFKFAPVIGELSADLALDPTSEPLPRFALARFGRGSSAVSSQ
jgi:sarcosine oxidase